jgi:hypothetical protein
VFLAKGRARASPWRRSILAGCVRQHVSMRGVCVCVCVSETTYAFFGRVFAQRGEGVGGAVGVLG